MVVDSLSPPVAGLRLDEVVIDEGFIRMNLTLTAATAVGSECDQLATRIHSSYERTVADLPWVGRVAQLNIKVRKFFCDR